MEEPRALRDSEHRSVPASGMLNVDSEEPTSRTSKDNLAPIDEENPLNTNDKSVKVDDASTQ